MKIIILFNHFQIQDGVARCAIGIANALAKRPNVTVTIRPLFKYEKVMRNQLDSRVEVKPVFKCYFPGFSRIVSKVPMRLLHNLLIGSDYDVEVGLCMSLPIKIVAAYPKEIDSNTKTRRYAWMHGYDKGVSLRKEYERIGKVVCVSKTNADRLRKESENRFDVDYAYNLLNDDEIVEKGKERIPLGRANEVQFVTVGRMSQEKGYMRLLEACRLLKDDGLKFNVWLIGDGPQREVLQKKAKDLKLKDAVTFLGQQSNPHAYTSKSDVFICSSYDEGYSTACTEAVILGVPVISTNVPGAKEIIEEAECGLIVSKEKDEELYQAMKSVIVNHNIVDEWKSTLGKTKNK